MRVLIIGGTRFVGRHIAEAVLAGGHDLVLLNRGSRIPAPSPMSNMCGPIARTAYRTRWPGGRSTRSSTPAPSFPRHVDALISTISVSQVTPGTDEAAPVWTFASAAA
jgi:2'-hydroxyisoflavone reductase